MLNADTLVLNLTHITKYPKHPRQTREVSFVILGHLKPPKLGRKPHVFVLSV